MNNRSATFRSCTEHLQAKSSNDNEKSDLQNCKIDVVNSWGKLGTPNQKPNVNWGHLFLVKHLQAINKTNKKMGVSNLESLTIVMISVCLLLIPVSGNKSSREEDAWEDTVPQRQIEGWTAASAVELQGTGGFRYEDSGSAAPHAHLGVSGL